MLLHITVISSRSVIVCSDVSQGWTIAHKNIKTLYVIKLFSTQIENCTPYCTSGLFKMIPPFYVVNGYCHIFVKC